MPGQTLYDKVFADHVVKQDDANTYLIYIDRHLVHEVTSPQAFEGLQNAGRQVRRLDCTLATVDHNIPTTSRKTYTNTETFIKEPDSRLQTVTIEHNVKQFGVEFYGMTDDRQGIVHVVGPEQGFTLPGTTVVCGDSHTSTHGAFGALAFGIGTSEVEHVLATQTLIQAKSKNMLINVTGELPLGVTSKDLMLHIIGVIGTAGGTGHVMELAGETIRGLSIEARMSMCNMAVEAGARAGMIAPDDTTFEYMKGRPLSPKGAEWEKAVAYWRTLHTDDDAVFDTRVEINAAEIIPTITWGTSPQDAVPITASAPDPAKESNELVRKDIERALHYMGLQPNEPMKGLTVDKVFIGSCTNSRIEDLRIAAAIVRGRKIASNIKLAMVVPGSGLVKKEAEREQLDKVFVDAGFDWREAGCSMCLGMNPDILSPQERCASTSNRNFEGRQGALGRTHLMSPAMAAAAALAGKIVDVRDYLPEDWSPAVALENPAKKSNDNSKEHAEVTPDHQSTLPENGINAAEAKDEMAMEEKVLNKKEGASGGIPQFQVETGVAAHLTKANIDTDAIIPKQFLKTIKRTGLSVGLFYELRNEPDASGKMVKTNFCLNVEPWSNAKVLVVSGDNFGCGSSREHAAWALTDFGIRCIIAPSFGDIFYNNSLKNALLPIRLPESVILEKLAPTADAGGKLSIDLPNQRILSETGEVLVDHFDIDPFRKDCLIKGLDDIGITMKKEADIAKYEKIRADKFSFLESESKRFLKKKFSAPAPQVGSIPAW